MKDINTMTVAELKVFAAENKITLKSRNKPDIIAEITAAMPAAATLPAGAQEGQEPPTPTNDMPDAEGAQEGTQAAAPPAATKPPDAQEAFAIRRVLKVAKPLMRGDDVAAVHAALIKAGFHVGKDSVEGIYGAQTAAAVRHLQAMKRRIVNGHVDMHTAQAMGLAFDDKPAAPPAK